MPLVGGHDDDELRRGAGALRSKGCAGVDLDEARPIRIGVSDQALEFRDESRVETGSRRNNFRSLSADPSHLPSLLVLDVAVLRLVLAPWQRCASTLSASEVIPARALRGYVCVSEVAFVTPVVR